MKKVAVVLSGCGVYDGSEIHESVLSLLAIEQNNAIWHCFAPNISQKATIDHVSGKETHENRSLLSEASRIARGNIKPLETLDPKTYDAIFLPGGFGVAINLSNYKEKGVDVDVNPILTKIILGFYDLKKPIGASCIAPILLAKIFPGQGIKLTLGTSPDSNQELATLGAIPISCGPLDIVFDEKTKIYTTPAYMEKTNIKEIYQGISKVIQHLVT